MPPDRFYEAPQVKVIISTRERATLTDLRHIATDRGLTVFRNAPRILTFTVPSDHPQVNIPAPPPDDEPFVAEGIRFADVFFREGMAGQGSDGAPWVHRAGLIVLKTTDTADTDHARTAVEAYDPWKYLYRRPVLLDNGDLPNEEGRVYPAGSTADQIILDQLALTEVSDGDCYISFDGGFFDGTIETTEALTERLVIQRGASIGELFDILVATGTCDIRLDPLYDWENRPTKLVQLNVFGEAGSLRPNAVFSWDRWPRSVVGLSLVDDGTQRINAIKMYAGGAGSSEALPTPVEVDNPSIAKFGLYWAQQNLPGIVTVDIAHMVAQRLLALNAQGQATYGITLAPERSPRTFTQYRECDKIRLYASRRFRNPIFGTELKVESIPIAIGDDHLPRVSNLLVSVDPEVEA